MKPPARVLQQRAREAKAHKASRAVQVAAILDRAPRLRDLADAAKEMTVPELLAAVRAASWLRTADQETRLLAMRLLSAPIERARHAAGKQALEDPLPGEPDDGWLALRALLADLPAPLTRPIKPPTKTREIKMSYIDMIACRIHNDADFSRVQTALRELFNGGTVATVTSTPAADAHQQTNEAFAARLAAEAPTPAAQEPAEEPTNATPPAVDAAGLPWDERIHASSKALIADGTWRKKRGVADDLVAQVEAELRGGSKEPEQPQASTEDDELAALLGGEPEAPQAEYLVFGGDGDKIDVAHDPEAWAERALEVLATLDDADAVMTFAKANTATVQLLPKPVQSSIIGRVSDAVQARKKALTEAAAAPAPAPARTYKSEDVLRAVQAYGKSNGFLALKKLFEDFGVAKFPDLKADQFPAVMAKVGG